MDFLKHLNEYSQLINTALLLGVITMLYRVFQLILKKKNTEIEYLKNFTVDNVVEKFNSLKEYYEVHVKSWYENSIKLLEEEKKKAILEKEESYKQQLIEEIKIRKQLIDDNLRLSDNINNANLNVSIEDVCGKYSVVGKNYESATLSYSGYLTITKEFDLLVAEWFLGPSKQKLKGKGILHNNSMSFIFGCEDKSYTNDLKGIVLYTFITKNIIIGRWSGFLINQHGIEEIRKIDSIA